MTEAQKTDQIPASAGTRPTSKTGRGNYQISSVFKTAATIVAPLAVVSTVLAGCGSDAYVASRNLSQAADQFEINRRIIFYNGITDKYMLVVEGRCSVEVDIVKKKLDVTCKTGPNEFKKDFLGFSDNVTWFAEQLDSAKVSTYHYRVVFKPQEIVPDIRFSGNANDLKEAVTPGARLPSIPSSSPSP